MSEKKTIEEYINENGSLVYTNVGVSMMPLLRQGKDVFTIRKKGPERCKVGDVVLYKRPPSSYVLHRIIEVKDDSYVIMGDNCVSKEYGIKDSDIIGIMTDYLTQERQSAGYLLQNLPKIDKCPEDSVNHHCGIVFADASITLSNDALELLKMSSLFQKIGDNRLAMKIIRAYDTCGSAVSNLNRHISQRNERFEEAGIPDLQAFLKSKAGSLYFRWLVNRPDPTLFADTADLQEAIDAIDAYMMK